MIHEALIDLLKSMTLEEKAGQLAQVPISTCIGGISQPTGPMEAYSLTPEMLKYCGSLICDSPGDAENTASAIRSVMEAHPHHIPPVVMKDIIHGCQTVFPIPLAIGSSFDENDAPLIRKKEGHTAVWEGLAEADLQEILFDMTFDAVYTPYQSVVAGNATRDNGLPVMLMEGSFKEEGILSMEPSDGSPELFVELLEG